MCYCSSCKFGPHRLFMQGTLLRLHCKEISSNVFPKNELLGLSHYFHIHVSVSDLYTVDSLPTIGPPIFLQKNRQTDRRNETVAAQFLVWEYLFRIFGIVSLRRKYSIVNSFIFLSLLPRLSMSAPRCKKWLAIKLIKLFPSRQSLVSDIPAGDGNVANLFLQCSPSPTPSTTFLAISTVSPPYRSDGKFVK
jgi:hypothetical protein